MPFVWENVHCLPDPGPDPRVSVTHVIWSHWGVVPFFQGHGCPGWSKTGPGLSLRTHLHHSESFPEVSVRPDIQNTLWPGWVVGWGSRKSQEPQSSSPGLGQGGSVAALGFYPLSNFVDESLFLKAGSACTGIFMLIWKGAFLSPS